jgi:hypothetical protein
VAVACAFASARRLAWVTAPTGLEPQMVLEAMRADPSKHALLDRLRGAPAVVDWERDLLGGVWGGPDAATRDAIADEQLLELRWRLRRWERVPRVCASIATSAGFLFATIVLLHTLEGVPDPRQALFDALAPLALGIAGTAFCVAVHVRARRLVPGRLAAYERLIDAARTDDFST